MADAMFSEAKAAYAQKGGDLRLGISWGSSSNTLDPAPILDSYMGTVNLTIRSLLAAGRDKGNISYRPGRNPSSLPTGPRPGPSSIRKGVTFHNGKDLTPNDVVASVRHHMGTRFEIGPESDASSRSRT